MVNVKSPICKTPLCSTTVSEKYEGYCLPCFIHMFPDKPNSRNYKTKERAVVEYVLKEFQTKPGLPTDVSWMDVQNADQISVWIWVLI